MRTRTAPENTILAAAVKGITAVKVEITDAAAAYQDWFSYLLGVSWGASIDQPIAEVRLNLKRDNGLANSLSPFRGDSTLNVGGAAIDAGRDIRISPATTAWGVTPVSGDYKKLFEGKTANIDFANASMEVLARDLGGALVQKQVKVASEFRSEAGEPLEDVIQAHLDTWAPGTTLYVPVSPGFQVTSIDWGKGSLFDAIRTAAGKIGWDIRYLWDNGTSAFRLTLFEPERTKTTPDWTFAADRYWKVVQLAINPEFIRNSVEVEFLNVATGQRERVFAADPISVARFEEQWAEIIEDDNSPINTTAEAQALADAALADLAWPIADKQVEVPFFWPVDVGDLIRFTANGVHSDEDIDLAVSGFQHRLDRKSARTTLTLRGKPAGFYKDWLRRIKDSKGAVVIEDALGLANFRETSRTDTTITYEWTRGGNVDGVWVYNKLRANPPPTDPWPTTSDIPDAILAVDTYTVVIPQPGYLRYLQFEPRNTALAVGPVERVIVSPTLDPPDRIHALEATINDDDGSAVIRVFGADRTRSYRYAYVVGAGEPAWPTDSAVEGGTVRTITGDDDFVLPAGTVGWNERLRVRAAPYQNADGTGTDGATDHGEIKSAEDIRLKPPVELEVTTETEVGAVGTFGVTVRDGSGIATDLYFRTKSGVDAFGVWTLKTATPTDGVEYQETVALIEDHPSHIEFALDYLYNGDLLRLVVGSSALDRGKIPNGVIKPILNENDDTASADLLGDFDTASWKVVAAVGAMPSDATARAASPVNGRMVRASVLGVLLTGLTMGQVVYFKAFGYSGAGGAGNESSAAITAEAVYTVKAPVLEATTATEGSGTGTFGVTVRDPAAQADDLYFRVKSGTGAYGARTLKTSSPTDNTEYQETVALVEDHPSHIRFELDYVLAGDPQTITLESPAFDRGQIPDGVIIPNISPDGTVGAVLKGDFDTASWKLLASTAGYPTDAAVRAAGAGNGRTISAPSLLTGVPLGTKVYFKAFAYSGAGGTGNESSAAILAETDRESAMMPKIQEEVVRSSTTATVTLTIRDEQKRITAIEFNKREGDGSASGWVSTWDSSTGTMGTNEALSRGESVTVAGGKDSEFRWRVTYTDELGVSRTIGNTVPLSNLDLVTKTLVIPHTAFVTAASGFPLEYNVIYITPESVGDAIGYASVPLPKGVTVIDVRARLHRGDTGDVAICRFIRVARDSSTSTTLATLTHASTGWVEYNAGIAQLVGDEAYSLQVDMEESGAGSSSARLAWVEITYSVPAAVNTY